MDNLPFLENLDVVEPAQFSPKLIAMDSSDKRSRPFNLLRAQLIKKLDQEGGRMIGITSAAPGAGKSFVASNLAASLGMLSNRHTYLIDLDLRRASIAHVFGIDGTVGVTEFLLGENMEFASLARRIGDSNLAVFPSFPSSVNSAELMVGDRFEAIIKFAKSLPADSIIIFDLPPVFANDDAILVSGSLDGILMVV